jgi:ADP-heptose:LPS heptosyltransferase
MTASARCRRILAVRLDNDGDVLLTGPAIRALEVRGGIVDLLVAPSGLSAARLLPGVGDVMVFDPPWSGFESPSTDAELVLDLVEQIRQRSYAEAVIFTSFHQSPLPMALLCRLAGVANIVASSEDYAGSLLDVRGRRMADGSADDGGPEGGHEVEAALALVAAAGYRLRPDDDGRLRVREPLPPPPQSLPTKPFVVVHPAASVQARSLDPAHARAIVTALVADGWPVVVTGGPADLELTACAAAPGAIDLGGRTDLAGLAAVLRAAETVVVGNTGPAHLAAAVGTPVVSLFAPVVPAARWRPWGVPYVLLGDQDAACRFTRSRVCPTPGHPCLSTVSPRQVASAVRDLAGSPVRRWATAVTRDGI